MDYEKIADLLDQVNTDLEYARKIEQSIPALLERRKQLETALYALEVVGESSNPVLPVGPKPSLDSSTESEASEPNAAADEFEEAFEEANNAPTVEVHSKVLASEVPADYFSETDEDHPADEALEEIKALDDEPTGDMTSALPNGGLPGNLY